MPKENLPEKINILKATEARTSVRGIVPIKQLDRLLHSLVNQDGEIEAIVDCDIDRQGIRFLRIHINAHLELQCQRCMEPLTYKVDADFLSGLVKTEDEAKELPDAYEPVLAEDGMVVLHDIVEDELIVGLPIIPMHDPKDCKIKSPTVTIVGSEQEQERGDNPFKVIEFLRVKRDANRN